MPELSADFASLEIRTDSLPCDSLDPTKICCADDQVKAKTNPCSNYIVDGQKHRYPQNIFCYTGYFTRERSLKAKKAEMLTRLRDQLQNLAKNNNKEGQNSILEIRIRILRSKESQRFFQLYFVLSRNPSKN